MRCATLTHRLIHSYIKATDRGNRPHLSVVICLFISFLSSPHICLGRKQRKRKRKEFTTNPNCYNLRLYPSKYNLSLLYSLSSISAIGMAERE